MTRRSPVEFLDGPPVPGVALTQSVGYDRRGKVTRQTDGNGHSDLMSYDVLGNLVALTEPAVGGQVAITSYRYDHAGALAAQADADGTVTTVSLYGLGRVTGTAASGPVVSAASKSFGYDVAGRMVSAVSGNDAPATFGYDAGAVRSFRRRVLGGPHRLAMTNWVVWCRGPMGTSTFGYDARSRMVSILVDLALLGRDPDTVLG